MKLSATLLLYSCLLFALPAHAAEPLKLSYTASDWKPFSYLDDAGVPKGIYNDMILKIFEKELGIKVSFIQAPWKRAQYLVETGKADFFITVKTEKRLEYTIATEQPLLQLYLHIFTYKDHSQLAEIQKITSGNDIKRLNLIPVTNIGNLWHKKNIDGYGVKTHYVEEEENAFQIVASRRADITIEPIYAGAHLIKELGLADKVVVTDARFGPINMHLMFGRKSPHLHLLPKINEAIDRLKEDGTFEKILGNYKKIK